MNKLEKLVPPLELCERIPVGKFEDSCFIWCWEDSDDPRAWRFVLYRSPKGEDLEMHQKCVCPAPTLQEILEALARLEVCPRMDVLYNVSGEICGCMNVGTRAVSFRGNPATAALQLWLEVEGAKDE